MSSFDYNKLNKRNIALDIIKCIGVLLITNAHSWDLWEVINRGIAVGGAQGVTLFFFVSGFALMIGTSREKSFGIFIKNKIKRLWPPLIIWTIISSALWGEYVCWQDFLAVRFRLWFISCILIYYIICYFIIPLANSQKKIWICFLGSIFISVAVIFVLPHTEHSIYVDYHYYMYLGSMILGMIIGEYERRGKLIVIKGFVSRFFCFIGSIVCLLTYFGIISLCKGSDNPYYFLQLIALIPLNLMALLFYFSFKGNDIKKYVLNKFVLRTPIIIISQLSLEIYIVQFVILSDNFNNLFPFNFIINYLLIILAAYGLKILSNIFIDIFTGNKVEFKEFLKL